MPYNIYLTICISATYNVFFTLFYLFYCTKKLYVLHPLFLLNYLCISNICRNFAVYLKESTCNKHM